MNKKTRNSKASAPSAPKDKSFISQRSAENNKETINKFPELREIEDLSGAESSRELKKKQAPSAFAYSSDKNKKKQEVVFETFENQNLILLKNNNNFRIENNNNYNNFENKNQNESMTKNTKINNNSNETNNNNETKYLGENDQNFDSIEIVDENAYYENFFKTANNNEINQINNVNKNGNSDWKKTENSVLFPLQLGNEPFSDANKKERLVKFKGYYILEQQRDSDNSLAGQYKSKLRNSRKKSSKKENSIKKRNFSEKEENNFSDNLNKNKIINENQNNNINYSNNNNNYPLLNSANINSNKKSENKNSLKDFITFNAEQALEIAYIADLARMRLVVENVESQVFRNSLKRVVKKCSNCESFFPLVLKFKTVEELVLYLKYIYESKEEFYFSDFFFYEKNLFDFICVEKHLSKILKQSLKCTKFLCNLCLVSFLNKPNGFFGLLKKFEISFENVFGNEDKEKENFNNLNINKNNKDENDDNNCKINENNDKNLIIYESDFSKKNKLSKTSKDEKLIYERFIVIEKNRLEGFDIDEQFFKANENTSYKENEDKKEEKKFLKKRRKRKVLFYDRKNKIIKKPKQLENNYALKSVSPYRSTFNYFNDKARSNCKANNLTAELNKLSGETTARKVSGLHKNEEKIIWDNQQYLALDVKLFNDLIPKRPQTNLENNKEFDFINKNKNEANLNKEKNNFNSTFLNNSIKLNKSYLSKESECDSLSQVKKINKNVAESKKNKMSFFNKNFMEDKLDFKINKEEADFENGNLRNANKLEECKMHDYDFLKEDYKNVKFYDFDFKEKLKIFNNVNCRKFEVENSDIINLNATENDNLIIINDKITENNLILNDEKVKNNLISEAENNNNNNNNICFDNNNVICYDVEQKAYENGQINIVDNLNENAANNLYDSNIIYNPVINNNYTDPNPHDEYLNLKETKNINDKYSIEYNVFPNSSCVNNNYNNFNPENNNVYNFPNNFKNESVLNNNNNNYINICNLPQNHFLIDNQKLENPNIKKQNNNFSHNPNKQNHFNNFNEMNNLTSNKIYREKANNEQPNFFSKNNSNRSDYNYQNQNLLLRERNSNLNNLIPQYKFDFQTMSQTTNENKMDFSNSKNNLENFLADNFNNKLLKDFISKTQNLTDFVYNPIENTRQKNYFENPDSFYSPNNLFDNAYEQKGFNSNNQYRNEENNPFSGFLCKNNNHLNLNTNKNKCFTDNFCSSVYAKMDDLKIDSLNHSDNLYLNNSKNPNNNNQFNSYNKPIKYDNISYNNNYNVLAFPVKKAFDHLNHFENESQFSTKAANMFNFNNNTFNFNYFAENPNSNSSNIPRRYQFENNNANFPNNQINKSFTNNNNEFCFPTYNKTLNNNPLITNNSLVFSEINRLKNIKNTKNLSSDIIYDCKKAANFDYNFLNFK